MVAKAVLRLGLVSLSQAFSRPLSQGGSLAVVFSDFHAAGTKGEITSQLPPSRPQFTEGPGQHQSFRDCHCCCLTLCFTLFFKLDSLFAEVNLFEKEPLPFPRNSLYSIKLLQHKNIHRSFLNSEQLETE